MKKLVLLLLAIGMFTAGFTKGPSPEKRATMRVNKMTETLDLDDTQRKQMYDLLVAKFTDMQTLRANNTDDMEGFKSEKKALHKKYKKEVNQLLTPAQLEKKKELHTKRKSMKAKRKSMTLDEKASLRVEKLDKIVTLSPEQKTEVNLLTKKKMMGMKDLREAHKGDPHKMKAERKVLRTDYKKNLKKLLTQEQKKKLKSFKAEKKAMKMKPITAPQD